MSEQTPNTRRVDTADGSAIFLDPRDRAFQRAFAGALGQSEEVLRHALMGGWTEVFQDADDAPIAVRPVPFSDFRWPERWPDSNQVRFPSDEKAARFVYARTDADRLELMMEAAQGLTKAVKALEVERDTLAQRIEALEAQVAEARASYGYPTDNSPALGGQKETT